MVFQNICDGLFNKHRLVFSFLLACTICIKETKTIMLEELQMIFKEFPKTITDVNMPVGFT